ncbi:hypothetical protein EXIGLDRAFT_233147 [Exidia glandulosa HHB12029]|uniref:Uncharacterized protein n=1 Tax=Exidia glandulosa HHB12029 TaxID=1314781 RepID=A0A165E362_EXIGL|nr:hypothetical protein EXIGLDRAFT_233147 [Exidia glandulosa HHB12029]
MSDRTRAIICLWTKQASEARPTTPAFCLPRPVLNAELRRHATLDASAIRPVQTPAVFGAVQGLGWALLYKPRASRARPTPSLGEQSRARLESTGALLLDDFVSSSRRPST